MLISVSGKINSGKDTVGKIIQYLTAKNEAILDINMPDRDYWINISFEDYFKYNMLVHKWQIKKFADKLKNIICILIGCTREQLEDESFKSKELGEEWWYFKGRNGSLISYSEYSKRNDEDLIKPTPRFLLQFIGTNLFRNQLHPEIWVNSLMSEYKLYKETKPFVNSTLKDDEYPNWIITDMRFPNELDAVKKRGGITIRVNRPCDICGGSGYHKMSCPVSKSGEHESETSLDKSKFDYVVDNDSDIQSLIEKIKQILIKERLL